MLAHVRVGLRELPLRRRLTLFHLLNKEMNLENLLLCLTDAEQETFLELQQQQRSKLPL